MYEGKQKLRNLQVRVYVAFACSSCTQLAHLRPTSASFFLSNFFNYWVIGVLNNEQLNQFHM
jgi:hypothetical protein